MQTLLTNTKTLEIVNSISAKDNDSVSVIRSYTGKMTQILNLVQDFLSVYATRSYEEPSGPSSLFIWLLTTFSGISRKINMLLDWVTAAWWMKLKLPQEKQLKS